MKTSSLIIGMVFCLSVGVSSLGQAATDTMIFNGASAGAGLGSMSGDVKVDIGGATVSGSTSNDSLHLDLKGGYGYLPGNNIGFLGRLTLLTKMSGEGWKSYSLLRPEANIALGIQDQFYIFGGFNLNKVLSGIGEGLSLGTGLQVGGGFKINPNVFIEGQYITSNFEKDSLDLGLNSFEISVGYAF